MPRCARYAPWVSSKARLDTELNDGQPGENLRKRPQVQTGGRSKSLERPCGEGKLWVLLPLPKHKSVHYQPEEQPTNQKRSRLRKLGASTQSTLLTALPTKVVKRRKSVKVFPPRVHEPSSTSNVRSGDSIDQSHKRGAIAAVLCGPQGSGALPESGPNKRLNRNISVFRPSTDVPSISPPPESPIPGLIVIMPIDDDDDDDDDVSTEPADTPPGRAPPAVPTRPLPPIPKSCTEPPPLTSEDASFSTYPERSRRQRRTLSMDELDYREVITAFLENDNPAFNDFPGMMDWRTPYIAAPAR